jgi:Acyl-CoA thioesterase C-terminal domain/Acyl-CoA thioesterase N-terminal domain
VEAPGWIVGRIAIEILRPVPLAPLAVAARVARPGRAVELVEAELSEAGGERRAIARATAWRLRPQDGVPEVALGPPPPGPERGREVAFFDTGQEVGYHTAMDYRFVEGAFLELGPALVWMRMRQPLVEGEAPSPLVRVLAAADSGNGVSAVLDYDRFVFINTDLTVQLVREPAGEWVYLDAVTRVGPDGVGLAESVLSDERGRIGRATQTLLVRRR